MTIESDFGSTDDYLPLEAALAVLSRFTKTSWVKDELFDAVVRSSLLVYAVSPAVAVVGVRSVEVNGSRTMLPVPGMGPRFALLLNHEIKQLGNNHPHIVTNRPALGPGDPDYKTWEEVKAGREARRVKPGERTKYDKWWEPPGFSGEWMGQSDIYFFTSSFSVRLGDLRFPSRTIIELIRKWEDSDARAEVRRLVPDFTPAPGHPSNAQVLQTQGIAEINMSSDSPQTAVSRPRVKWDTYKLRQLLDESREAGATHEKLATKYGVSRQRVAALLKRADREFGVKKANAFTLLQTTKR